MEKTRDLFKKIRDTKGTFHAKMGTMKNRNGMDFPGGSDGKTSVYNVGDLGSIPGLGSSLEKEMSTHSSTLA